MTEVEISTKTRSRAYQFVKSLMNDVEGDKVHNLIDAIRENVSEDVAGTVLMDLLKNPSDPNADLKEHSTWFGPVRFNCFKVLLSSWAVFCEREEIRGHIVFKHEGWDKWNAATNPPLSEKELDEKKSSATNQVITIIWWSDDHTAKKARKWASDALDWVKEADED